jgi:phosphopantothenoylcysteine decarboxylase/phosphopantothenate--cysteine ligase
MNLLITAGPTREYLDPVRFLSNASSGRLGTALAARAKAQGHRVTLILGPCPAAPPKVDELVRVTSTQEMLEAVAARFGAADALIAAAAVCDFRPASRQPHKIKKTGGRVVLELEETPDILAAMAAQRKRQVLIGFCLESEDLEKRAREKLRAKRLDLIVANGPTAIGADRQDALILAADGRLRRLAAVSKADLAAEILHDLAAIRAAARPEPPTSERKPR